MPARTGDDVLTRLRERPPNLWLDGEQVADPTTHPATAGMAKAGNAAPRKAPEQGQEPLLKGKALERFEEKLRSGKQI